MSTRFSPHPLRWSVAAAALAALVVAVIVLMSGSGSAQGRPAATGHRAVTASGTVISARRTDIGTILVDSRGDVIYAFSRDGRNHDVCVKISGCISEWPMITGRPSAGRGVKSGLLGSITVAGRRQITYAGHPLYSFQDGEPGSTSYVGEEESGGTWPAVSATGKLIN